MRYQGQGYEIEVSLPDGLELGQAFARLDELFRARYAEVFADNDIVTGLKLRGAWGKAGQQPDAFAAPITPSMSR